MRTKLKEVEKIAIQLSGYSEDWWNTIKGSERHSWLAAAKWHLDKMDERDKEVAAMLHAVVVTIGGTVEGLPTHTGNYIQRLRELVKTEKEMMKWENP